MNLRQLITSSIALVDGIPTKPPRKQEILAPLVSRENNKAYQFEDQVINHLFQQRQSLGIQHLYRLQNALADGYLILTDGTGVALEFKLALNWNKSNVARSQLINFQHYHIHTTLKLPPPAFGLILFDHFTADWKRVQGGRPHANGWYRFEQEQAGFEEVMKMRILQVKAGRVYQPGDKTA